MEINAHAELLRLENSGIVREANAANRLAFCNQFASICINLARKFSMAVLCRIPQHLVVAAMVSCLLACSSGNTPPAPSESAGQVKPVAANKMTFYAASRAAEQVSFGATPALLAELSQQGLAV